MNATTRVKIFDEIVYISLNGNTLGKGMIPIILLPATGKSQGRLGYLNF